MNKKELENIIKESEAVREAIKKEFQKKRL